MQDRSDTSNIDPSASDALSISDPDRRQVNSCIETTDSDENNYAVKKGEVKDQYMEKEESDDKKFRVSLEEKSLENKEQCRVKQKQDGETKVLKHEFESNEKLHLVSDHAMSDDVQKDVSLPVTQDELLASSSDEDLLDNDIINKFASTVKVNFIKCYLYRLLTILLIMILLN